MISFKTSIVALVLGVTVLLLSCNDKEKVETVASTEVLELPNLLSDSIVVVRSDSARTTLRFSAPNLISDVDENNLEYYECPDGFLVERFDEEGEIIMRLSAEYGKQFVKEERYEALGNVVVLTEQGDTLKTEQLIYLKRKDRIYSEKYIRIIQEDRTIHGKGFESDANMKNREIFEPYGTIWVDESQMKPNNAAQSDSLTNDSI